MLSPVPGFPPKILQRSMLQTSLTDAGVEWMSSTAADRVVANFFASGRRLIVIDGFMGSGKSPFGSMIEWRLAARCLRLDSYVRIPPPSSKPLFIERVNLERLTADLTSELQKGTAIIEGVLVRELLDRLGIIRDEDVLHVYVTRARKSDNLRVIWLDESQLNSTQGEPLHQQIVEYRRAWIPHEAFDVLVLRNQNEPEASGIFIVPDGQSLEIRHAVWPYAHLNELRVSRFSFECTDAEAKSLPTGLIRPPLLGPLTRSLDDRRLRDALQAIRFSTPLPPVKVICEPEQEVATLLDGAHRYFGSVAAGLVEIPVEHVSVEMAELSHGYQVIERRNP